ncbi:MAG: T9SS C-terminal target domain-containing protein, partial [Prevotella sp.]|nr:T9SS C-terminal target domain-containing protein [Prevotella sp.]
YGTTTGIKQVETNNKFAFEGDRIIVDGTRNQVSAFALDGKAVNLSPAIAGDKTIIPLDELTHGVYIIKINNKSIKVARQ